MKKKLIALGMSLALGVTSMMSVSNNAYAYFEEVDYTAPSGKISYDTKDFSRMQIGIKVQNVMCAKDAGDGIESNDVWIETDEQRKLKEQLNKFKNEMDDIAERYKSNTDIGDYAYRGFHDSMYTWGDDFDSFYADVYYKGYDILNRVCDLIVQASTTSGEEYKINPNAYQELEDTYFYLKNDLYLAMLPNTGEITKGIVTTRSSIENQCDAWLNFLKCEYNRDSNRDNGGYADSSIWVAMKVLEIKKKAIISLFNDLDGLERYIGTTLEYYRNSGVLGSIGPTVAPTNMPEKTIEATTVPTEMPKSTPTTIPTSTVAASPTNTVSSTDMPSKEEQPQATSIASNGAITASEPVIITYNVVSGSAIEPTIGNTEKLPVVSTVTPEREGFSFQGWIDEVGNPIVAGTVIKKNTTLTAQWKEIEFSWNVQIKDTTSSQITLSLQDKNTSTTYIPLRKKIVLKLEGSRDSSEGSTPVVFEYQIVNKGNEYVATDWKPAANGIISVSSSKKCRIYIRAISGKNSKVYRTNGFYIDSAAPQISGIKNGKIYKKSVKIRVSDKVSGVKKILLNGKKIKSGKVVSKKGAYKLVVMDVAGNKKSVRFAIMR